MTLTLSQKLSNLSQLRQKTSVTRNSVPPVLAIRPTLKNVPVVADSTCTTRFRFSFLPPLLSPIAILPSLQSRPLPACETPPASPVSPDQSRVPLLKRAKSSASRNARATSLGGSALGPVPSRKSMPMYSLTYPHTHIHTNASVCTGW